MANLPDLVPDIDTLLALQPEELGEVLLGLAKDMTQSVGFLPGNATDNHALYGTGIPGGRVYPRGREDQIEIAVGEGWHWLSLNLLIMPAPGPNGANGWRVITRRGRALLGDQKAFRSYAAAAEFPKSLLHPAFRQDVWLQLAGGNHADAVFKAFRTVEEAVREAGNFRPEDVGVDLMRLAFNQANGPLRRQSDPKAERERLSDLFAGAIGSYKNPHSHRTVQLDAQDAREMVVLASHLLRIVEARRLQS